MSVLRGAASHFSRCDEIKSTRVSGTGLWECYTLIAFRVIESRRAEGAPIDSALGRPTSPRYLHSAGLYTRRSAGPSIRDDVDAANFSLLF